MGGKERGEKWKMNMRTRGCPEFMIEVKKMIAVMRMITQVIHVPWEAVEA